MDIERAFGAGLQDFRCDTPIAIEVRSGKGSAESIVHITDVLFWWSACLPALSDC